MRRVDSLRGGEIEAALEAAERDARAQFAGELNSVANVALRRSIDLRYSGQAYELTIPLPEGPLNVVALVEEFHREHERTYGHRSHSDPVAVVNLRLVVSASQRSAGCIGERPTAALGGRAIPPSERQAYFGPRFGSRATPVIERENLTADWRDGPFIVEEFGATCVVPPEVRGRRDAVGNIILQAASAA